MRSASIGAYSPRRSADRTIYGFGSISVASQRIEFGGESRYIYQFAQRVYLRPGRSVHPGFFDGRVSRLGLSRRRDWKE
jgi:hypothetical protein